MSLPTREPFVSLRRLKGNAKLLPIYAAVLTQARRSMDDWIPLADLEAFEEFTGRLGLTVLRDCIFEPLPQERPVDALQRSPTTHNRGLSFRDRKSASSRAHAHVFVSTRRQWAEEALVSFSYPVAVPRDRLLIRPRVDATRVGAAFGYPSCCIEAFMKRNDWTRGSHVSQTFKSAGPVDWRANSLPRDTPFMTIFQTPCRPTCEPSLDMSQRTWDAVHVFDPQYASQIADRLRGVFLVINEAVVYKLVEPTREGKSRYRFRRAEPVVPPRSVVPRQVTSLRALFLGATHVELTDGIILTRTPEERFYEVDPTSDWVDDPCFVEFR